MTQRSLPIDSLKALAAGFIVLHHLAFYGPMADHVLPLAPGVWAWLASDARMAVQVFLVIGGYLAARSLAPTGSLGAAPLSGVLWSRFLRLVLPYHVILLIAIAGNEIARSLMAHESISAPASLDQFVAHALLLQDILGYESLSAGLWYVAIDMQLFLLMTALLGLGRFTDTAARQAYPGWRINSSIVLVTLAGLSSLYYFNRDHGWDAWAVYFFGVYALGALVWWVSCQTRALAWLAAMTAGAAGALLVVFRERLVLALVVALLLGVVALRRRHAQPSVHRLSRPPGALARAIHGSARISYSLFLVHFPVCLVVNAAVSRFLPLTVGWQLLGICTAFAASVAAAAVFHAHVEAPLLRWLAGRRAIVYSPVPRR